MNTGMINAIRHMSRPIAFVNTPSLIFEVFRVGIMGPLATGDQVSALLEHFDAALEVAGYQRVAAVR